MKLLLKISLALLSLYGGNLLAISLMPNEKATDFIGFSIGCVLIVLIFTIINPKYLKAKKDTIHSMRLTWLTIAIMSSLCGTAVFRLQGNDLFGFVNYDYAIGILLMTCIQFPLLLATLPRSPRRNFIYNTFYMLTLLIIVLMYWEVQTITIQGTYKDVRQIYMHQDFQKATK